MLNDIGLLRALAGIANDQQFPNDPRELKKALTTASGFLGIQLVAAAKLMLPRFAGLRNRLAVTANPLGAAQSTWRAQLGYGSFNFATAFGTANGAIGSATVESATTFASDYKTQAINGGVQFEAIRQAEGWDNAMTIDTKVALSVLLLLEELEVLYASESALGTPAPAGNPSVPHTVPNFATGNWRIRVSALTGIGTNANASSNSNTGETVIGSVTIAAGASGCDWFDISVPYIPGALGYKVYCETAVASGVWALCDPNTDLAYAKVDSAGLYTTQPGDNISVGSGAVNTQTYITVTRFQVRHTGSYTGSPAPAGADGSANANVFEGVNSWCTKATVYGTSLPYRLVTDMQGLGLTTQGTGIKEIDNILYNQWVTNQISPTLIITSAHGIVSMGNRLVAAGNSSQFRLDVYKDRNSIVGGMYVGGYVNKFASSMIGSQATVDVWAHPYMPDGAYLFLAEDLPPETYPYTGIGKTLELDVATPYTYFELARTDRSFPYSVFYNETLRNYWPNAFSAIVGCRMDS